MILCRDTACRVSITLPSQGRGLSDDVLNHWFGTHRDSAKVKPSRGETLSEGLGRLLHVATWLTAIALFNPAF
ncbi:MAG: hypothetical protein HW399_1030 [Dehalococcoidia bacterium]|nr:hypothetical protein [Dehalococcoidia bacterium]